MSRREIQIVIYRENESELDALLKAFCSKLNVPYYKDEHRICLGKGLLTRVIINGRSGDPLSMGGLRPDFFNADTDIAENILWQCVSKTGGTQMVCARDALKIVDILKVDGVEK